MQKEQFNTETLSYLDATGPIAVTLRNDMMFHRVMQSSNNALKGLVCALKGLEPSTVKEVILMNPIDYSEYAHKEIILDVKVMLNSNEVLDIELQLYYSRDWVQRSLLYLCRSFDSISVGENYEKLMPTTVIAIMDNPLFPEFPEFYSHYQILNTKNHRPYTTMLNINVLYLNRTELATEEDISNGLLYWAELFQATTWEELKKICESKSEFKEVAGIMYKSNIQSQERTLFEAHQKFLMDQASMKINAHDEGYEEGYEKAKEEMSQQLSALDAENARLRQLLAEAGIMDKK